MSPRHRPAYTRFVARRLAACALTFVLAATPVAIAVCEAACAGRDTQAATTSRHSCHEHLLSQYGPAIGAIHLCGHDDGAPTVLERIVQHIIPPAVMPAIAVAASSRQVPLLAVAPFDSSPPTPLNLISQLRV